MGIAAGQLFRLLGLECLHVGLLLLLQDGAQNFCSLMLLKGGAITFLEDDVIILLYLEVVEGLLNRKNLVLFNLVGLDLDVVRSR